jgi:hypothetical protein
VGDRWPRPAVGRAFAARRGRAISETPKTPTHYSATNDDVLGDIERDLRFRPTETSDPEYLNREQIDAYNSELVSHGETKAYQRVLGANHVLFDFRDIPFSHGDRSVVLAREFPRSRGYPPRHEEFCEAVDFLPTASKIFSWGETFPLDTMAN